VEINTSHSVKGIFFLPVFVFINIGVVHLLSHALSHDDFEDCEQCILIVDFNKTGPQ